MDDVFASIASGVLTADLDHKITLSNSVAEKLLGLPQADLVGQNVNQIPLFNMINLESYLIRVC
jgi:PAS domain-containing protein